MKASFWKQRWLWLGAAVCGGYFLTLLLLLAAERGHPDASIVTLWDAVWYSFVTLSTVGYGDLYPVTAVGRVIGIVFVLMSAGVLTFLLGIFVSVVTGRVVPALRLAMLQNRAWYVFPRANPETVALARDLTETEKNGAIIFLEAPHTADVPHLRFPGSLETLVKRCRSRELCTVFFLGENASETEAGRLLPLGCRVICQTGQASDFAPEGLSFFDACEATARLYWQEQPLEKNEETVVILGCGAYARQLLERGLLMNIGVVRSGVTYHVFDDWTEFRREHRQLSETLAQPGAEGDRLVFHEEGWNADFDLLRRARRIIICTDDMEQNILLSRRLRRYFPVEGAVHLRAEGREAGAVCFGGTQQICSGEMVLRRKLNHMAEQMHEIYRRSVGRAVPVWGELSEFLRQSNIAAADHLLTKVRLLLEDDGITRIDRGLYKKAFARYCETRAVRGEEYRRIEHLRWMRFHSLYNWRFAEERNDVARCHPMMRPFEELSPEERRKDDFAWELLGQLSNFPENE